MTEQKFLDIIEKLKSHFLKERQAYAVGIDVISFSDALNNVISDLLVDKFGQEKTNVLNWYLYEYRYGQMKLSDAKTGKVLYDLDKEGDLWKYMNEK